MPSSRPPVERHAGAHPGARWARLVRPLLGLGLALSLHAAGVGAQPLPDFQGHRPSAQARFATEAILAGDHHLGRPFAVVDKLDARLYVFDRDGRLVGQTPALLGQQPGDHTVPGVGDKPPSQVLPHERTTPAGRFAGEPGFNDEGDAVIWVDYDSGLAIHRVRPGASYELRMQRLAQPGVAGKRVSLGCVVVDGTFFDTVVRPTLGRSKSVIYVLPETRPVATLFGPTLALR